MQHFAVLLGFIAILQMIFIPGYLILRLFRLEMPALRAILLSFALSLLANYGLVVALTLAHAYTPKVVWCVVGLEAIVLSYLLWPTRSGWHSWHKQIKLCQEFWFELNQGSLIDRFIRQAILFIAICIILIFVGAFISQLGQIFTAWDPVMSYNVWAEQWAGGQLAQDTWHYPQLIPVNWSITYVMTRPASLGANLEFFAKAVMPLFPIMLLLSFIDLALETRRIAYVLAIIFTAYFLSRYAESFGQGWVDVPMATLAFLSISLLYLARKNERPLAYLVLSALICAAAAVTKQAGLYILFWYPALCYGLAFAPANRSLKKIWLIIGVWLLSLAISLPWYIFIQDQIIHGLASSEVGFVTSNIYQLLGFDWGFRIAIGIFQLGFIFWVLLAVAIWYALNRSTWRILIVLIIPYTLIWLGFYSYALRNFTLISPLLGLIAALGCEKLYSTGLLRKQAKKVLRFLCLHELKPLHVIFAISIAVAFVSLIPQYSAPNLVQAQIAQKRLLGDSGLNKMLFQYQASHGFSGKILTSWDYLGHVPGLAQYYQPYRPGDVEGNPYQSSWMMDPKQLPSVLAAYPAHYILVANEWGLASDAYLQYFAQLESQHVLKAVLRLPDFTLYEIVQAIPRQQS